MSTPRDRRKAGGRKRLYDSDSTVLYGLARHRHTPSGHRRFNDLRSPINELSQLNGLISHRILYCMVHSRRGGPAAHRNGKPLRGRNLAAKRQLRGVVGRGALDISHTRTVRVQYTLFVQPVRLHMITN